jgi:DHA1 family multidrug resistance protein-like MFS transporter
LFLAPLSAFLSATPADWAASCTKAVPVLSWLSRRPRFRPLAQWERDQYVVVLTVALAHVAFDLTQPFIPLYVRDLGITDLADAAFWSGIVVGTGPLCGSLMGPFWGALADKYGRKPMVLRAMIMIGIMQVAIAFVPDVYWLVGLRVIMGIFAGFTPMAMALAISLGPREKMAHAIGMVQAAQFLPLAIGPTIGGVISDLYGLRVNFMLTGVILIVPALLLYLLVKETGYGASAEKRGAGATSGQISVWTILALPGFAAAMAILFLSRFTDRMLPPILPLYLVELNTPTAQLATITGFVVASGAVAAACSSMLYGRWARPENTCRLLIAALAGGAIFSVMIAFVGGWVEVTLLRIMLGLLAGGAMSLAYTLGAHMAPSSRSGVTLSMLSSCGQLGGATAPMLAGLIGQIGLVYVFIANGAAYLLALVLTALPTMSRAPEPEPNPQIP